MDVDQRRYHSRLWSIRDSQILCYLQNIKQSMRRRYLHLRQFSSERG